MNRSFLKLAVIGTIAALALGARALALPITGSVDLAGGAVLNNTDLALATQVSSWGAVTVATPFGVTPGSVLDTTINPGDSVTMAAGSWAFNSGKPSLWSVGGFTFSLNTSTVALQNSSFLNVYGTGTITGNGYDATPGLWYFTSQGAGSGLNGTTFSFSATTASVPDGGTTALLLGLGLTSLALLGRKHRKIA